MQKTLVFLLAVALAACGGSSSPGGVTAPPPPRKPDPFITIRVRDQLDTTTAVGRTQWHVYVLLTGPQVNQNGIAFQGDIQLSDRRMGITTRCMSIGADSVGQRYVETFALGDTTTEQASSHAKADSIVNAVYNGARTLPPGWKALFIQPTDAWNSQQYQAGHGRTDGDPIKWSWDWTGAGTTTFYERAATDTTACNRA